MRSMPRVSQDDAQGRPIYLDNHATTPVDPRVARVMYDATLLTYGNPSSSEHFYGEQADSLLGSARLEVAALIGAPAAGVIFTSGATEALNLAIEGFVRRGIRSGMARPIRVGLLPLEHVAVVTICRKLKEDGLVSLTYFKVDRCGRVDLDDFTRKCQDGLDLVCVMGANNEIGTVYPLKTAAGIAKSHGATFLTDATQSAGKVPISFSEWGLDLLVFSAHKIYGPKGVGALVVSSASLLEPIAFGGGHERGLRPGTPNVPGIAGLAEACRLRRIEMDDDEKAIGSRRDRLEAALARAVPDIRVNGDREHRLAGNLHVSVPGIPGSAVVARLRGTVAISTGSACTSGAEGPSHVLQAIGLNDSEKAGALRIGLGKFTKDEEVEASTELIGNAALAVSQAMSREEMEQGAVEIRRAAQDLKGVAREGHDVQRHSTLR